MSPSRTLKIHLGIFILCLNCFPIVQLDGASLTSSKNKDFFKSFEMFCNQNIIGHLNCTEEENPAIGQLQCNIECLKNEVNIFITKPDQSKLLISLCLSGKKLILKHLPFNKEGTALPELIYGGYAEPSKNNGSRRFFPTGTDKEIRFHKGNCFWELNFDTFNKTFSYIEYKADLINYCVTFYITGP